MSCLFRTEPSSVADGLAACLADTIHRRSCFCAPSEKRWSHRMLIRSPRDRSRRTGGSQRSAPSACGSTGTTPAPTGSRSLRARSEDRRSSEGIRRPVDPRRRHQRPHLHRRSSSSCGSGPHGWRTSATGFDWDGNPIRPAGRRRCRRTPALGTLGPGRRTPVSFPGTSSTTSSKRAWTAWHVPQNPSSTGEP